MKHRLARIATHPLSLVLLALLMLYTLAGFTLVPWLVERYAPRIVAERTGHTLRIGDVQANPYLFRLDIHDVVLLAPDDETVASLDRLLVDLQLSSLFGRAWTFKTVQLEQPVVHIALEENGRLNLAALVPEDRSPPPSEPPPRSVPRFVVQQGSITNGKVTFTDRTLPGTPAVTVAPIDVSVNDLATVPDREGRYKVTAALPDGARIAWHGDMSLQPLASAGELTLDGLRASTVWPFVGRRLALSQPAAVISLAGNYRFAYTRGEVTLAIDGARIAASDIRVPLADDAQPDLTLASLTAEGIRFDLGARELAIAQVEARNGHVAAEVDAQGHLDWARVMAAEQRGAGGSRTAETDAAAAGAEHDAGAVAGTDRRTTSRSRAPGAGEVDAQTAGQLDAQRDAGRASGTNAQTTERSESPWHISVAKAVIENVSATYSDASREEPLRAQAELSRAQAAIKATLGRGTPELVVDGLNATLGTLSVGIASAQSPLLAVDALRVEQAHANTGTRKLRANAVAIEGGKAVVERDAQGEIGLVAAFGAAEATSGNGTDTSETSEDSAAERARAEAAPWSYALDQLRIADFLLTLRELSFDPPIEYDVIVSSATVSNIARESEQPMQFQLAAEAKAGGTLQGKGEIAQDFARASGNVTVDAFALGPMQPYLNRYATLVVKSGIASGSANVQYALEQSEPRVNATGALQVSNLLVNEQASGDRFLSWKTLSARDMTFSSAPARLAIREVRLAEPGAKVVISKDRQLNVAQVLRDRPSDAGAKMNDGKAGPPFAVNIERVVLRGGTVNFADSSLVLPFSTTVQSFDGSVVGISTDRTKRAEVQAAGRIDHYGAANLSGTILPFAPTQYTNLHAEFENVSLPPFSPYSATFAGRKIESGRLWLDLHYRIEHAKLLGEHEIVLSNFELGERVEAPNALDLPLDLAIALLTNSEGRINIAIPVRGDLDNPQFSYSHLIAEAFRNVLQRIVTAPFRALGALVGGGEDQRAPHAIAFAPGEAALAPPEREKLDRLAQVLRERPKLQLVVQQVYDPHSDAAALRADAARRALAEKLGRSLEPNEDPGLVAYGDARTQQALERMYTERLGEDAVARFAAEYAKVTGREPERVNATLAFFGRGSEDTHFYTALFERLVQTQPLPDDALQQLAARRAEHIESYLVKEAGLDASRVRAGEVQQAQVQEGDIVAELKLDVLQEG